MRAATFGIFFGALALSACATAPNVSRDTQPVPSRWVEGATRVYSAFDNRWAETPFEHGAMSIVAAERGDLRTFRIVPCHDGIVCSNTARGRHGRIETQGDVTVVSGLFGRTFYLERGGDGRVERRGHSAPLAWDSDVVRVGGE